jgi:tetrapyrrole methylase family protein/MazG family protein
LNKVEEEIRELRIAMRSSPAADGDIAQPSRQEQITAEMGDVLFSLVNLARFVKVNPEDALRLATNRFSERFHYIETQAQASGRTIDELSFAEMDRLWEQAKAQSRTASVAVKTEPSGKEQRNARA